MQQRVPGLVTHDGSDRVGCDHVILSNILFTRDSQLLHYTAGRITWGNEPQSQNSCASASTREDSMKSNAQNVRVFFDLKERFLNVAHRSRSRPNSEESEFAAKNGWDRDRTECLHVTISKGLCVPVGTMVNIEFFPIGEQNSCDIVYFRLEIHSLEVYFAWRAFQNLALLLKEEPEQNGNYDYPVGLLELQDAFGRLSLEHDLELDVLDEETASSTYMASPLFDRTLHRFPITRGESVNVHLSLYNSSGLRFCVDSIDVENGSETDPYFQIKYEHTISYLLPPVENTIRWKNILLQSNVNECLRPQKEYETKEVYTQVEEWLCEVKRFPFFEEVQKLHQLLSFEDEGSLRSVFIAGPRGCGKTVLANVFATYLNLKNLKRPSHVSPPDTDAFFLDQANELGALPEFIAVRTLSIKDIIGFQLNASFETIRHRLHCFKNSVIMLQPCLVIIEDIDLLEMHVSYLEGSDIISNDMCGVLLHETLNFLMTSSQHKVRCIITMKSEKYLPERLRDSSLISTGITMHAPNPQQRFKIIQYLFPDWCPDFCHSITAMTNMWLPIELAQLPRTQASKEQMVPGGVCDSFPPLESRKMIIRKVKEHIPMLIEQIKNVTIIRAHTITTMCESGNVSAPRPAYVPLASSWTTLHDVLIRPLRCLEKLHKGNLTLPRGILIYGPSGCGKTLMLKHVAREILDSDDINVNIISVDATALVSKYVGESEKNLAQLFEAARTAAPTVLLIDHMERLARDRRCASSSTEERLLSTLLVQLDGFSSRIDDSVIVIGTVEKLQYLDAAAIRSGRFDFHIPIPYPTYNEKKALLASFLNTTLEKRNFISDACIENICTIENIRTPADIENRFLRAAWCAARRNSTSINDDDFKNALIDVDVEH